MITKKKSEDSLKKRYLTKLAANLIGLFINVITNMIIPRGLGPKLYGDFGFITNIFNQIVCFFDVGMSLAFYTKLSQRPKETSLITFYIYFFSCVSLLLVVFTGLLYFTDTYQYLLPGQTFTIIYFSLGWALLVWITDIFGKIGDAYALTVRIEIIKLLQKAVGLGIISGLFFLNKFDLITLFLSNYFLLLLLLVSLITIINKYGDTIFYNLCLSIQQIKKYMWEFYQYSQPLLTYALFGLVLGIADRWFLQRFSGSVEQGFFDLSYRIGGICFLFTSSITPLLTREFSIAFSKKDPKEMSRLFRRYVPLLYAIAAFFVCFVTINAETITFLFGGNKYAHAAIPVAIMAFFPIHQTYGQINGSIFYSTANTSLYRNTGIFIMIAGLPVTYFLLAPASVFGMNSGAVGLAIKMVLLQFIGVNLQFYFVAKILNLRFWYYIGHQFLCVIILIILSLTAKLVISWIAGFFDYIIVTFIGSGILYSILVTILVAKFPLAIGLYKEDVIEIIKKIKHFLAMV